jgi:hypothetical protein
MTGSLATLPLRVSLRSARATLRTTRDLADLGLAALELLGDALGDDVAPTPSWADSRPAVVSDPAAPPVDADVADPADVVVPEPVTPAPEPVAAPEAVSPVTDAAPAHVTQEAELVETVAEPGAQDGAGAAIRIEPPFAGYDGLRAVDVIGRLSSVDGAELAETELYERAHRARRTVLDAIAREARRRGPR